MVRLSDILKKKLQESTSRKESPKQPQEEPQVKPAQSEPVTQSPSLQLGKSISPEGSQQSSPQGAPLRISKAIEELGVNLERSRTIYKKGILLAQETTGCLKEKKGIELQKIKEFIEELVNCLVLKDVSLFALFHEDYPADEYLYRRATNVTLMSIEVGLGLKYNKSQLNNLALAAFFYDIGMEEVKDIALQKRPLSEKERDQIKGHPFRSAAVISEIKDVSEDVMLAIKQHHEYFDGTGYPRGMRNHEISEYARIIAVVDVYEALTHSRTYRKRFSPHYTIKHMISSEAQHFDKKILKILIARVSIYPIGSWVELNTKEIGKVINVNEELPLRPVVSLFFDHSGNTLGQARVINLAQQCNLYVQRPLTDDEVTQLIAKEQN